jgi:hypothetical protein
MDQGARNCQRVRVEMLLAEKSNSGLSRNTVRLIRACLSVCALRRLTNFHHRYVKGLVELGDGSVELHLGYVFCGAGPCYAFAEGLLWLGDGFSGKI